MSKQKLTTQEIFLKKMSEKKKIVNIFLYNGIKITGRIADFDKFTINIPDFEGDDQLVYKNSISTIRVFKKSDDKKRYDDNFGNSDSYSTTMKDIGFMREKKYK